MSRMENMLVCVRASFLSRALALPPQQLKLFLMENSKNKTDLHDDAFVWLARDITITNVQSSLSFMFSTWRGIIAAASAAKTLCHLWRQHWRSMWAESGATLQLHGLTGAEKSSAEAEAARDFERKFSDWAQASCASLWQPAAIYGACLKMVEISLDSVCCMMEVPVLQKSVYGRIGGERLLDVICPHRRHLKILQLWTQVRPSGRSGCASLCQVFNAVQVASRLARLTPHTSSAVSGAAIELQGNVLQACVATIGFISQALQPITNLPHGVDWYGVLSTPGTACTS
jgi:hypothetical protein